MVVSAIDSEKRMAAKAIAEISVFQDSETENRCRENPRCRGIFPQNSDTADPRFLRYFDTIRASFRLRGKMLLRRFLAVSCAANQSPALSRAAKTRTGAVSFRHLERWRRNRRPPPGDRFGGKLPSLRTWFGVSD
jgi:hypothetical protein